MELTGFRMERIPDLTATARARSTAGGYRTRAPEGPSAYRFVNCR